MSKRFSLKDWFKGGHDVPWEGDILTRAYEEWYPVIVDDELTSFPLDNEGKVFLVKGMPPDVRVDGVMNGDIVYFGKDNEIVATITNHLGYCNIIDGEPVD